MRICFVTPRFPYPPLKGDTLRVYHQLRALSREHRITLVSLAEEPVSECVYAEVAAMCERVEVVQLARARVLLNLGTGVLAREPLQVLYYHEPKFQERLEEILTSQDFDVVHATLIRMLPYVWSRSGPPVAVDLIDSLGLNLAARRKQVGGIKRMGYELEYRRVRRYESAVVRRFPALVVSSEADRRALGGRSNVKVRPNGVDLEQFAFQGAEGREPATLVFTGNMGYHPNEEAVVWMAGEVWPLLRARHPNVRLQIVGATPTDRVRALHDANNGIEVLGKVPEVTTYLHKATIAVCPMRSGSGIQNKVLEAMATGTPVVATSIANRGVQGHPDRDLLVADTAEAFAQAIANLLDNPPRRERLATSAQHFVAQRFQWLEHGRKLTEIYHQLQHRNTAAKR
ncbi:MAG TPA: glycosyltransferase [Chloroflexia bacterium]|nr:glycosyltransferase [Chloroflexia bacterium]